MVKIEKLAGGIEDKSSAFALEDVEVRELYLDGNLLDDEDVRVLQRAFLKVYLSPQYDREGKLYFNPNGAVSRAEVISALGSGKDKRKSIDGVSLETDFFNAGYNDLVDTKESPFYGMYSKEDLNGNIRRIELACMLACHKDYIFGKDRQLETCLPELYRYEDIKSLPMVLSNERFKRSLILPDGYESVEDYFYKVRTGEDYLQADVLVLTSLLMSMIEGVVTLTRLNPLKGVSRLEWAYLMNEIEGLRMESQWS